VGTAAALLAVTFLAVLTLLLAGAGFARSLRRERDSARFQLERARQNLMTAQLLRVAAVYEENPWQARELLEDAEACPPGLRDFAWGHYFHRCRLDDQVLLRWREPLLMMALSPDGRRVALVDNRGVQIRDARDGAEVRRIPVRPFTAVVAFDPGGTILAVPGDHRKDEDGSEWSAVSLWDVNAGKEVARLEGHKGQIGSLAFSPDGRTLAVGSVGHLTNRSVSGGLKLWDVVARQERPAPPLANGRARYLAISPDGRTLAYAHLSGDLTTHSLRLWDLSKGGERSVPIDPDFQLSGMTFSPDSRLLALGGGFVVKLLDAAELQTRAVLGGHSRRADVLSFRADGKVLATSSGETVRLWDVAAGKLVGVLRPGGRADGAVGHTLAAAFNPDGALVTATNVSGAVSGNRAPAEVRLWDARRGRAPAFRELPTGAETVGSLSFDDGGEALATIGRDLCVWDLAAGQKTCLSRGGPDLATFELAQFDAGGRTVRAVALGDGRGIIRSWAVADGEVRDKAEFPAAERGNKVALSRDGRTLALGYAWGGIQLIDGTSGAEVRTLYGHKEDVTCLAFREDGRMLASGDQGGSLTLWDAASGSKRASLAGHATAVSSLAVSRDGNLVASGGRDGTVKFWDVTAANELASVQGHAAVVEALAFSPDGRTLASTSRDGTIVLWEPTTGQQRAVLTGHDGWVWSAAFSPDGKTLATAGADHCVRLWQAAFPE
jgi:WD40 repeat protein